MLVAFRKAVMDMIRVGALKNKVLCFGETFHRNINFQNKPGKMKNHLAFCGIKKLGQTIVQYALSLCLHVQLLFKQQT